MTRQCYIIVEVFIYRRKIIFSKYERYEGAGDYDKRYFSSNPADHCRCSDYLHYKGKEKRCCVHRMFLYRELCGEKKSRFSVQLSLIWFCTMVDSLNDVRGDILGKARVSPFLINLLVSRLSTSAWVAVNLIMLYKIRFAACFLGRGNHWNYSL